MAGSSATLQYAPNVSLLLSWPCHLDRMFIYCCSNLSIYKREAFAGQQNMCPHVWEMSETAFPAPCKQTGKIDILVTNSFICRGNPISPGYLWESSVSQCARDSEETLESWSRICEHYDGCDTQHWHSENGLFFGFSLGWNWTNQIYCILTVI